MLQAGAVRLWSYFCEIIGGLRGKIMDWNEEQPTGNEHCTWKLCDLNIFSNYLAYLSIHHPVLSSMWTHVWEPCPLRFSFWVAMSLGGRIFPKRSNTREFSHTRIHNMFEMDIQSYLFSSIGIDMVSNCLLIYWYSIIPHEFWWYLMVPDDIECNLF